MIQKPHNIAKFGTKNIYIIPDIQHKKEYKPQVIQKRRKKKNMNLKSSKLHTIHQSTSTTEKQRLEARGILRQLSRAQ